MSKNKFTHETGNDETEISQPETQADIGQNDDLVAGEKEIVDDELSPPEDLNLKLQLEKENSIALTKMLQQLQADFSNYRKRNASIASDARQNGIFDAVKALLPALDAIEAAEKHITDTDTLKGFEMIKRAFIDNLRSLGIEPIATVGCQYDPNLHNVVVAEEIEGVPSGQIVEEFKSGFSSPNGVVRVAMVKIAK